MKRFGFFVLVIGVLSAELVLAAESPVGKWKTIDEKSGKVTSQVEIYEQSGKLFGKIAASQRFASRVWVPTKTNRSQGSSFSGI